VLLYGLAGHMCCWVFWVTMCGAGSFRWQYEMLGLLSGKVICLVF